MDLSWQNRKKLMGLIAFGIFLYVMLQNIGVVSIQLQGLLNILTPFLLGSCIAFVVNIPMNFLEKKLSGKKKRKNKKTRDVNKFKRFIAILISFLMILFAISTLFKIVVPEITNVIKNFIQYLSTLPSEITPFLNEIVTNYPELGEEVSELKIDFSNVLNSAIGILKNAGSGLINLVGKTVSSAVSVIANLVIGIIFAFYLLLSKEKIARNLKRIVIAYMPEKYAKRTLEIMVLSKNAFTNFITGQLKEAIILGVLCYIGMTILRIPYSLTISLLAMTTAFVPIVGAFIGAAVGVVLLLAISPIKALTFLIFIIVLQQIETNLIYPRVVGKSVGLPGVVVLVALALGSGFGGAVGMLVSLPITSVIYTLLRESVSRKLKEKNLENVV